MKTTRLTEAKVQILLKANRPTVAAMGDGSGLCLRVTPSGASWQLRYRHAGRAHWLTLGSAHECSLKEARIRATEQRARIDKGGDPVAERRRARAELKAAKTFSDLVDDFKARSFPNKAESTRVNYRRYFERDLLPRLGRLRIDEIDAGVIVRMVEAIEKRTAAGARRAFTMVNTVFAHAQAKHLVKTNPCAGLKLAAILGRQQPLNPGISLTEAQLREILPALSAIGRGNALAVKIILATAVRKSEFCMARWEHIDFEAAAWSLPQENTKTRASFVIPLAPVVVGWFRELQELACGMPWVIPGQNRRDPICGFTLNKALTRLPDKLPHFHVHDLRRTARTHLSRLGVDVIVAEKCLNHRLGGMIDIYDRSDYLKERRQALQLLADFLVGCESENVIALRKAI